MTWQNWAGNVTAHPLIVQPGSVAEIQSLLATGGSVRALGSGHSFTPVAATDGTLMQLRRMNHVVGVDVAKRQVRVQAGITIRELNRELAQRGLALPNLGDIDAQSIAGAISTGTHGTGREFQGIAAAVVALQLVLADGSILDVDSSHPWFDAARVSLGALGIITEVTLQCVPAFLLHAREEPMSLDVVLDGLDEFVAANDHFEFYWFPHTTKALTKRNNRVAAEVEPKPLPRWRYMLDDELLSNVLYEQVQRFATRVPRTVKPINAVSGTLLGAREYVDASYEVFASPRRVRFTESEFALPIENAREAIEALQNWFNSGSEKVSFPIEVRFAAADDIWLSTGHGRANVYIAVHQFHRQDNSRYFAAAQEIFTALGGRPHWGKLHSLSADYFALTYEHFDDFRAIRGEADPTGTLLNAHLKTLLAP